LTGQDPEQLRGLLHELAEALTATDAYLHGGLRLEGRDGRHDAISKAIEQTNRAGEVVAKLRALLGA
jgi:hypothetical protein